MEYKRLVETDLPIKVVSEYATREKNVRQGHIANLHIWWARRPLAACRAVLLAALLPDPLDPGCPPEFQRLAWKLLLPLGGKYRQDDVILQKALLDFVAEFSNWEKSKDERYIRIARDLVGSIYGKQKPLVVDPFAGGGAIPLEALRLGTDVFAMDYDPIAVLLLKTCLEYIPRYGARLARETKELGELVKKQAEEKLSQFYPQDKDGSTPLAYLWARTAKCEGPKCGAEIPLLKQLAIVDRGNKKVAFSLSADKRNKQVDLDIVSPKQIGVTEGTVRRGAVTCPICDYTMPVERIRAQANTLGLGTRMIATVTYNVESGERKYRVPLKADLDAVSVAERKFSGLGIKHKGNLSLVPDEPLPPQGTLGPRVINYGMKKWGDLFTTRQALAISTFCDILSKMNPDDEFRKAVIACVALALSNTIHYQSNLSTYLSDGMVSVFIQGVGFPMRWDFAEANPLIDKLVGGFDYSLKQVVKVIEENTGLFGTQASVGCGSATSIPLPDNSASVLFTDPPYYDSIPYANAADLFYVWLHRAIQQVHPDLFKESTTPKDEEIIVNVIPDDSARSKDKSFYESRMRQALTECRRVLDPSGIAVIVFAHKSTSGWEALVNAIIGSGWQITASWPIETERASRMRAYQTASLASSVHLVCRPRPDKAVVGDWRDVLAQLQPRVHSWMQRLVKENIVGADAIFACIGPALEIFSKYERIETAGGKKIELLEYLQHVWAAVAKEALDMIFEGADPSGFEQDSRLTAMWLWTLRSRADGTDKKVAVREGARGKPSEKVKGYPLEYDAVRKIAQGLGAHLEKLIRPGGLIEIKGNVATLLFVTERREALLGKSSERQKGPRNQMTLLGEPAADISGSTTEAGRTTLDKLQQAMLLFGDGRTEALRRFLVDEGVGRDNRFWRLADALSALYPRNSEERRWVEGVVTRKKALGF